MSFMAGWYKDIRLFRNNVSRGDRIGLEFALVVSSFGGGENRVSGYCLDNPKVKDVKSGACLFSDEPNGKYAFTLMWYGGKFFKVRGGDKRRRVDKYCVLRRAIIGQKLADVVSEENVGRR